MNDPYYESRFKYDSTRDVVWKEVVRYESRFIPPDAVVLDLGAGYCNFINNIRAKKKYALDISPELTHFAGKDVTTIQKAPWELGQLSDLSVDVVHASNFLEHFTDDELEKIMREIKRVLKPGGRLILMQPNYRFSYVEYFDDYTHKKVFSDIALEGFLSSHAFTTIVKKPRFLPYSMRSKPSMIPGALLSLVVRLYLNSPWKPRAGQMLFVAQKR